MKLPKSSSAKKDIEESFKESIAVKQKILKGQLDTIQEIAGRVVESLKNGGKILLCGNGGSAADSQHIACELVGRFKMERSPLPAIALSTDTSILTSLANDYSYDVVFERQIRALAARGDLLIAISTSGSSPNILKAARAAKEMGLKTVAFTGSRGGELEKIVDICFKVPSDETPRIQESHITAAHAICEVAESMLYDK